MNDTFKYNPIGLPQWQPTRRQKLLTILAHLSAVLAFVGSLPTGGLGLLFFPFIPAIIYWRTRDVDYYVEHHALQATALSTMLTLGLLAYIVTGMVGLTVLWIVIAALCTILIGVVLIPIGLIITIVFPITVLIYPLVLTTYGIVAISNASQGKSYRYPYFGAWANRQRVLAMVARDRGHMPSSG